MSLSNLRQMADALRENEQGIGADKVRPLEFRLTSPLLLEVVHAIINQQTMIEALERRLEKLEGAGTHHDPL